MISLPTPPTDNLYKFMFVFGIILLVTTTYFFKEVIIQQLANINTANELSHIQLLNANKNLELADSISKQHFKTTEGWQKASDQLNLITLKLNDRYKTDSIREDIKFKLNNLEFTSFTQACLLLFITGITITVAGGLMWFLNTQRYQDDILRLQLEQLKKETH